MIDIDTQAKLINRCSQTQEGKALLTFIEELAVRKLRGTTDDILLQAGMLNLWLAIQEEIEAGNGE